MPVFPCPTRVPPGPECDENPIRNLSAERTDGPTFLGGWKPIINPNPIDPDPTVYTSEMCNITCRSTISQADADACAQRFAYLCANNDGGPPILPPCDNPPCNSPDIPTGSSFFNVEKTATAKCPDGSEFTATVTAATIAAASQALADQLAQQLATDRANKGLFCLGDILAEVCANDNYFSEIVPTGGTAPFDFSFKLGGPGTPNWPPGYTTEAFPAGAVNRFRISGSNSVPGAYSFTIKMTDSTGLSVTRTYTITVVGFTDPSVLPPATIGQPYSYQLNPVTVGGPVSVDNSTVNKLLPAGLQIDNNFLISGTPTGPIGTSQPFTVEVFDAGVVPPGINSGIVNPCAKTFTIQVQAGHCIDWTQLTWDALTIEGGGGIATFMHSGKTAQWLVDLRGTGQPNRGILGNFAHTVGGHLTIPALAAPCICQLSLDIDPTKVQTTVGTNDRAGISVYANGVLKASGNYWANNQPGPFSAWNLFDDAGSRQASIAVKHQVLTFTLPAGTTTILVADNDPFGSDYFAAVASVADCVSLNVEFFASPDTAPP